METAVKNKSFIKPKTMAELLPELASILSKDSRQTLTAKKLPRPTVCQTRTAEKVFKPLTIAELRTAIKALKEQSPKRNPQPNTATKKLNWNSSVKPVKTKSHTNEGQLRHNSVRKTLNFQPKPKPTTNVRATLISSETPKFPKPELRAKKSLHLQDKTSVRISGICNIPPTPIAKPQIKMQSSKIAKPQIKMQSPKIAKPQIKMQSPKIAKPQIKMQSPKIAKPQIKMQQSNKENKPYQNNINRKTMATPKNIIQKKFKQTVIDTPLSNISLKSNGDASFLLKEQEINDIEERTRALGEESTLENIAEISPPVSTPFKEYRNIQEFFNNTCDTEQSFNDNSVMSDKVSVSKKTDKREQSVIVSLCDMLNKASVTHTDKTNTELNDLLELKKQTQQHIQMIEIGIQTLKHIKESKLKSLLYFEKLINDKNANATAVNLKTETPVKELNPENSPILRASVIKIKSPSYKIPRKNMCLRKKVISKSMIVESEEMQTPVKSTDKAFNMYMQIKETMNFLNTPLVKRNLGPPDTPSLTSHNLQKQLDKLYNGS